MYVEEKNRSWCTSSNANDQRAVTIECASDTTHPYAMRDVVYATLIELCVDICKRNGKTKLLWLVDKDKTLAYTPAADEIKNKNFWLALIPAVLLLVQVVAAVFEIQIDLGGLSDKLLAVVNAVFVVLAILGIVTDPTTEGVRDSKLAMTYEEPKKKNADY